VKNIVEFALIALCTVLYKIPHVGFNDPKSAPQIHHGLQGVWTTDYGG